MVPLVEKGAVTTFTEDEKRHPRTLNGPGIFFVPATVTYPRVDEFYDDKGGKPCRK
jgi:hypothetical protein